MKNPKSRIDVENALIAKIHESVPALEWIADHELLTMRHYQDLVDDAQKNIKRASYKELLDWYEEWM